MIKATEQKVTEQKGKTSRSSINLFQRLNLLDEVDSVVSVVLNVEDRWNIKYFRSRAELMETW